MGFWFTWVRQQYLTGLNYHNRGQHRIKSAKDQVPSAGLEAAGLSKSTAAKVKIVSDPARGGALAAGSKIATATKVANEAKQARIIENNMNADLPNVLDGNPNAPADIVITNKKAVDVDLGTNNPQYDSRHGVYTTLESQYDRAMTGVSPSLGVNGRVDDASKFFNSTDMDYAMKEAERLYAQNPSLYTDPDNGKISVEINFGRPVGEGYIKNNNTNQINGTAGEYRWTNVVSVGLDRNTKKPYTAFPNISKGVSKPDPLTH